MGRNILRRLTAISMFLAWGFLLHAGPLPVSPGLALAAPQTPPVSGPGLEPAFKSLLAPEHVFFDSVSYPPVQEEIKRILGKTKWFAGVVDQSRFFREIILSQLASWKLPRELFYLVMVESEFNPNAYSRSGAAGLWQFMPNSTPENVRMDLWQDERFDFEKAGRTALGKLLYNYHSTGAWSPALGAYNCGLGLMKRILPPGMDYWNPAIQQKLPEETRHYVPRILASAWVGEHRGRLGFPMSWGEAVFWDTLVFSRPVQLKDLARHIGIPFSLMLLFNPEYRFEVPAPDSGQYRVRLPREFADAYINELQP